MNKTSIKNYAIWARNELISRVSQKAYEFGVEKDNILPYDAQSINGRLLSDDEKKKRQILINEVKRKGYDQVIEEVAYTWFNRFIALRFMEVNNYLPDKVRLFTNENNEFKPQIIDEALHIDLLGLDKNKVLQFKDSNNNEELYKELLLATCNDMSRYLPGMFKPIDDFMTLLFPSNLLREESVIGRMISDIDENSWKDQVQIIGWLYQYYNTEPKDKTFANLKKNIKINKDTIAPATQLFTPDWIVRYMTENSLGRLWLDGHPDTDCKSNWKYYLDETKQDESVQIELNKIKAEHAKLRPEDIKFLDPCMGSGHILVYAFDIFMQIYVSQGWTEREAAKSILQNNIYGLDIDERAFQLSYFALMMKARQYNRRILSEGIVPNVVAIEESNTINKELLKRFGDLKTLAERLVNAFTDAKEYGSILSVEFTKEEIDSLEDKLDEINKMSSYGNLLDQIESDQLSYDFYPLIKQVRIMCQEYECIVTNPPYMGNGSMNSLLSEYVKKRFPLTKNDLSTVFMEKCSQMCNNSGYVSMINIPVWMFLSGYEKMRYSFLNSMTFINLVHPGRGIFGSDFGTVTFVLQKGLTEHYKGCYRRLFVNQGDVESVEKREAQYISGIGTFITDQSIFIDIPGAPLAYWISNNEFNAFSSGKLLSTLGKSTKGIITGNNDRYMRLWWETNISSISFLSSDVEDSIRSGYKWFPCSKGGDYRKWYGNKEYILDWQNNGYRIIHDAKKEKRHSQDYYNDLKFKRGISWSSITISICSFREENNNLIEHAGMAIFPYDTDKFEEYMGFMNSCVANQYLSFLSPTVTVNAGEIGRLPVLNFSEKGITIKELVNKCINLSKTDWDYFETSWDFRRHPLVVDRKEWNDQRSLGMNGQARYDSVSLISKRYDIWKKECNDRFNQLKNNEETLNQIFIDIYGLQEELTPNVEEKNITVRKADLQREIRSLISYAVGCMFGRYSLDVDGLVYAGGEWIDDKYKSFIPDKDNIIPICDDEYFNDDITGRFIEFIRTAYGEDTLEENLSFIAGALGGKGTPREAIRNYFINDFYKDHMSVYSGNVGKRPIYWQFDSGKKNGFKALVYIHRYTPDLIARMRTSYVHEQQSRYENQISMIQNRIDSAASTSERVKAEKELKKLKDQADELRIYEEKIHHWADKMEPMDLDDGVKANYAKFQELLTKIK